jgi:DNA-binding LacI/PurR family transcriptional regulator
MTRSPHRFVSMRQIAEALKVHPSTVSEALRNDPLLPAATRRRVEKKARELGYKPDPMLRSLQVYAKRSQQKRTITTVALLSMGSSVKSWRQHHLGEQCYRGIYQRLKELGYRMEEFCVGQLESEGKDLHRILETRGIRALVLSPSCLVDKHQTLPWAKYAAVTVGYSLRKPSVHRAVHHYRFAVETAVQQLRKRGYRKMAFIYSPVDEERLRDGWTSGFRLEQGRALEGEELLMVPTPFSADICRFHDELRVFVDWYEKEKPEVMLTTMENMQDMLEKHLKVKIPQEVGLIQLAIDPQQTRYSGIDQRLDRVGAAAVDMLDSMLHQNEYGLPTVPKTVMLEGDWVDGETVRECKPAS